MRRCIDSSLFRAAPTVLSPSCFATYLLQKWRLLWRCTGRSVRCDSQATLFLCFFETFFQVFYCFWFISTPRCFFPALCLLSCFLPRGIQGHFPSQGDPRSKDQEEDGQLKRRTPRRAGRHHAMEDGPRCPRWATWALRQAFSNQTLKLKRASPTCLPLRSTLRKDVQFTE